MRLLFINALNIGQIPPCLRIYDVITQTIMFICHLFKKLLQLLLFTKLLCCFLIFVLFSFPRTFNLTNSTCDGILCIISTLCIIMLYYFIFLPVNNLRYFLFLFFDTPNRHHIFLNKTLIFNKHGKNNKGSQLQDHTRHIHPETYSNVSCQK